VLQLAVIKLFACSCWTNTVNGETEKMQLIYSWHSQ